ncbi:MAG TPA: MBL fold metallo-hydrolase [Bacillota bacterium]|nr:MBL fold metallo-hydrolase [Bacillota bacterium]
MDTLQIGKIKLTWLRGGNITLDGGTMFGVVPKSVWTRKYPCNESNLIPMVTDPILVQYADKNFLIDSGLGAGKLSDKHKKIFGVTRESFLEEQLAGLGLHADDIHGILMTHLHNDHAAGLTKLGNNGYEPVFSKAVHYIHATEWEEVQNPNLRSRGTYLKENWQPIADLVETFTEANEVAPGIEIIHTGGHSAGYSMIKIESEGQAAYHLGDLLPSHAHQNPLWVMAYDDYPMNSISVKQKWITNAASQGAWLTFYHDYFVRAIKWDEEGNVIDKVENEHAS